MKNLTLSKLDLGILITSCVIFNLSWYRLTAALGSFNYIMIQVIMPIVIGIFGFIHIFMQKQNRTNIILLASGALLDVGFGIWFTIRILTHITAFSTGHETFILVIEAFTFGFLYLTPAIPFGYKAYIMHKKEDEQKKLDFDFNTITSMIGVSSLVPFFYNQFFNSVIIMEMGHGFVEIFYSILTIVSFFVISLGFYGNVKNNKLFLGIFTLFSLFFWSWYFFGFVIVSKYDFHVNFVKGGWVGLNAIFFTLLNVFQLIKIHQNKDASVSYDQLLS